MATLIALNGRKGSGKDSAFSFIRDWAGERGFRAARRGFADDLKWSAARIFNPTMTREEAILWCDEIKNSAAYAEEVYRDSETSLTTIRTEITGRTFLQRYGTESHRDIFGEDFWINLLLPLDREWLPNFAFRHHPIGDEYLPDIAVITDCRFENEALRVRELGGMIWKIDLVIPNTGSLRTLGERVFNTCDATIPDGVRQ